MARGRPRIQGQQALAKKGRLLGGKRHSTEIAWGEEGPNVSVREKKQKTVGRILYMGGGNSIVQQEKLIIYGIEQGPRKVVKGGGAK